jgi:CRP-like cAMP-binding protein
MVPPDAADQFLQAPWMPAMEAAARRAVLAVLREERADAGATLAAQGKLNGRIHFLLDGAVVVVRTFPDGHDEVVGHLQAPTVIGELSFFRRCPCLMSVRTTAPSRFLVLDHDAHEALRREDPRAAEQLALAAVQLLAERFEGLDRKVTNFLADQEKAQALARSSEWTAFRGRLFEESAL